MTGTRFDPAAHAKAMRDGGFWVDKNYDEFLQLTIARTPDKLALVADRADRPGARRFTYAELGDAVSRAAASLSRMGVGICGHHARRIPHRRRRQPLDAYLPRA